MLQLQRPPVLLLRAHAAYKTSLWKLQPFFRTWGERLAVNKLSFPNNRSSYVRRSSMSLVQNMSQRIPQFHKNVSKIAQRHEYKLPSAAINIRKWRQKTYWKGMKDTGTSNVSHVSRKPLQCIDVTTPIVGHVVEVMFFGVFHWWENDVIF